MTREILSAILAALVAGILLFPVTMPQPKGAGFAVGGFAVKAPVLRG